MNVNTAIGVCWINQVNTEQDEKKVFFFFFYKTVVSYFGKQHNSVSIYDVQLVLHGFHI